MEITLNIGLQVANNYLPSGVDEMHWKYRHVKNCLEKNIGVPSCIGIARTATEKTVVVQYKDVKEVKEVLSKLFSLAKELKQDCIAYAVHADDGNVLGGALVGEYAHEWNYGVFKEEYFIPVSSTLHYRTVLPL